MPGSYPCSRNVHLTAYLPAHSNLDRKKRKKTAMRLNFSQEMNNNGGNIQYLREFHQKTLGNHWLLVLPPIFSFVLDAPGYFLSMRH